MNNFLDVYLQGIKAGQLKRIEKNSFVFTYTKDWLKPENPFRMRLSVRLPLQEETFSDEVSKIFFSNLLPEGEIRNSIANKKGISPEDDFELLKALGGECAGAITIGEEIPLLDISPALTRMHITDKEMNRMLEKLPDYPILLEDSSRLSLAGVQQKLPIYVANDNLYFCNNGFPSSHILKPQNKRFKDLVENETFCMKLAKKAGLPVPETNILLRYSQPIYIIERYDRAREAAGLKRIHQEDFCQALGYGYSQKYETKDGPNLKQCFELISEYSSQSLLDSKALLQWVIFNVLIGNCDAHCKNLSLLIESEKITLAPFYDLLSTSIYPLEKKLAMRIGGGNKAEWISKGRWQRLSKEIGVSPRQTLEFCREMAGTLPSLATQFKSEFVPKYGAENTVTLICDYIVKMSNRMSENLSK